MDIVVGTAGHIDHGKTALIKMLTGVDADRLPEEKQRGITIDLGFAEARFGDIHFGFVDVPGHERFVKNMLAGASGIDLVMLVVASDEGVMPQTREHFAICRLLGVQTGVVVLTKTDIADANSVELSRIQVSELTAGSFLASAPFVSVSSRTGDGLDQLREALVQQAAKQSRTADRFATRLPIDRSFSVKGFGTVVTGTLVSGEIRETAELELLPARANVRVRGLQTHGRSVVGVGRGQRTAVNIAGVDYEQVARGMSLVEKGSLRPTHTIDARVEVLADAPNEIRSRQRVRLHIGTAEILARVSVITEAGHLAPGESGFVQLRLESPAVAALGERFILRSYSPQTTIAGGIVLDPGAAKSRRRDTAQRSGFLSKINDSIERPADIVALLIDAGDVNGLSHADLRSRTGFAQTVLNDSLRELVADGQVHSFDNHYISVSSLTKLLSAAVATISDHHKNEPLSKGLSRETLREKVFMHLPGEIFTFTTSELERSGKVIVEREIIRLTDHGTFLTPAEAEVRGRLREMYTAAGLTVPRLADALSVAVAGSGVSIQTARKLFQMLVDSRELVKVSDEFYFSNKALQDVLIRLRDFAKVTPHRLIDVPKFKDVAGVSRKYAIPLLEHFDREKITRRVGDKRFIL